jgi:hypothetical protein
MASPTNLRSRRSAAQLHALAGVEREIRAQDSHNRRKYLREFNQAFRSYESLLNSDQIHQAVHPADIVLVGDYHALPAAQRCAATLLEQRALAGDRPVVLGVETIFARDQQILDEWWRREIDEDELRQRIRFDLDWGYDWTPFRDLLVAARDHAEGLYGLDCMPRGDFRQASIHDRHAAARIAEIGRRHPDAVIMVLFGESHLAPEHLPRLLRQGCPGQRVVTVLQNVDALYWRAAGESCHQVHGVRVCDDVICVFNATPLEKYENYRLCLERWGAGESDAPDFSPAVYNLIHGLAQFLNINFYSPHNGTQPKFLIDLLPEVYPDPLDSVFRKFVGGEALLRRLEERGSIYVARTNTLFIREFHLSFAVQEVARFLHHACRGLPGNQAVPKSEENGADRAGVLHAEVLESALTSLAAHVLCPVGAAAAHPQSECEAESAGFALGAALYDAYVEGRVTRTFLRRLFLAHLEEPGVARETCLAAYRKAGLSLPLSFTSPSRPSCRRKRATDDE